MIEAIINHDLARVRELLHREPSLANTRNSANNTPLHHDAKLNKTSLQIAKLLLDHGADVNAQDKSKKTPLHWIVRHHKVDKIELFLKSGADPNAQDKDGKSALHYALHYRIENIKSVVKLLLKHGADVNIVSNDGQTPLMCRACCYDLELVRMLVEAGAQVNNVFENAIWNTLLNFMVGSQASWEIIEYLICKGAKANIRTPKLQMTLLHVLAECCSRVFKRDYQNADHIVKLLIKHGVDIDSCDLDQKTAIDYAQENNDVRLIRIFIEAGASFDFTVKVDSEGNTRLHQLLKQNWPTNLMEMTQLYLEHGADLEAVNDMGETPLHIAVRVYHIEVVHLIFEKVTGLTLEAPIKNLQPIRQWHNPRDNRNLYSYILSITAVLDFNDILNKLLERCYEGEAKNKLFGPEDVQEALYFAVKAQNFRIAKILLEAGGRVNLKIIRALDKGVLYTRPLYHYEDMKLACLLLEYKADLWREDDFVSQILKEWNISTHQSLITLLICYYIIDVRSNKKTSSSILPLIESSKHLLQIYQDCDRRLEELIYPPKYKIKSDKYPSVFGILSRRLDSLVTFFGDETNKDYFARMARMYSGYLEIHECVIKLRIDLALEKRELLDFASGVFEEFIRPRLPKEMIEKILDYLNVRELQILTLKINENY